MVVEERKQIRNLGWRLFPGDDRDSSDIDNHYSPHLSPPPHTSAPRLIMVHKAALEPLRKGFPRSLPVPGYQHFLTPLRKLIFDYDAESPAQSGMRCVLRGALRALRLWENGRCAVKLYKSWESDTQDIPSEAARRARAREPRRRGRCAQAEAWDCRRHPRALW